MHFWCLHINVGFDEEAVFSVRWVVGSPKNIAISVRSVFLPETTFVYGWMARFSEKLAKSPPN